MPNSNKATSPPQPQPTESRPGHWHELISGAVHEGHRRAVSDEEGVVRPLVVLLLKHGWAVSIDAARRWAGGLMFAAVATLAVAGLLLVLAKVQGWIT